MLNYFFIESWQNTKMVSKFSEFLNFFLQYLFDFMMYNNWLTTNDDLRRNKANSTYDHVIMTRQEYTNHDDDKNENSHQ